MACNYCSKVEGLPKVDHVLNVGGKQVYQCPMCTEYIVEIRKATASSKPHAYNYAGLAGFAGMPAGAFGIKAPKAKPATKAQGTKKDKGSGNKLIYVGYDSAGIHKMIGDYREDYLIDPDHWYIAFTGAAKAGKQLRKALSNIEDFTTWKEVKDDNG